MWLSQHTDLHYYKDGDKFKLCHSKYLFARNRLFDELRDLALFDSRVLSSPFPGNATCNLHGQKQASSNVSPRKAC